MHTSSALVAADLEWIINTPPLLSGFSCLQSDAQGLLPAPLRVPEPVPPSPDAGRLGYYYEWLWHQLLRTQPVEYEENIIVRGGGETLGELDLVYRAQASEQAVHRELAIKFYLQSPGTDGSEPWHWVGANVRDRLDLKLAKLLGQQLRLTHRPQTQTLLRQRQLEKPKVEGLLQGRLFSQWQKKLRLPVELRSYPPQGVWLYQAQLATFLAQHRSYRWYRLARGDWLAGVGSEINPGEIEALSSDALCQYRLVTTGSTPIFLMVVPDQWRHEVEENWLKRPVQGWAELHRLDQISCRYPCAGGSGLTDPG